MTEIRRLFRTDWRRYTAPPERCQQNSDFACGTQFIGFRRRFDLFDGADTIDLSTVPRSFWDTHFV